MNEEHILDTIIVNGKEYKGIIDYDNQKHLMFYDFTNEDSSTITLLIIVWRTTEPNERFSVFRAKNFPHVDIGSVSMVRKTSIDYHTEKEQVQEDYTSTRIKSRPTKQ